MENPSRGPRPPTYILKPKFYLSSFISPSLVHASAPSTGTCLQLLADNLLFLIAKSWLTQTFWWASLTLAWHWWVVKSEAQLALWAWGMEPGERSVFPYPFPLDDHGWFLSPCNTGTRVCEEQPTVLSGLQTDKKNLRNASGEITVSQCDPWIFGFMFCHLGKGRLWFCLALLHSCSVSKPPGSPP